MFATVIRVSKNYCITCHKKCWGSVTFWWRIRIRIRGSVPLTNDPDPNPDPTDSFSDLPACTLLLTKGAGSNPESDSFLQ
jgi:hypothetical protein